MAISPKPTSGQLPEPASGVGRCSTADKSYADNCRFVRNLGVLKGCPTCNDRFRHADFRY